MKDQSVSTVNISHQSWLNERRKGIGGSDVAAILGLSPFSTPVSIYLDKIGEGEAVESNSSMKWGLLLEDAIAAEFQNNHEQFKVMKDNKIRKHKDHDFLIANVDRIIRSSEGSGILEIKTTNSFYASTWETDIPLHYYCQLQHYLSVLNYSFGYIAVLIDGRDYHEHRFERDDSFIETMNERLIYFWNENVQKRIAPAAINSDDIKRLYKQSKELSTIEADFTALQTFKELLHIKDQIKELEKEKEAKEFILQNYMQENEALTSDDKILCTWKSSIRNSFDSKKFKEDHADLYSQYMKQSNSRTFLTKKI